MDPRQSLKTERGAIDRSETCDPGAFEYDAMLAGSLFSNGFEHGTYWVGM